MRAQAAEGSAEQDVGRLESQFLLSSLRGWASTSTLIGVHVTRVIVQNGGARVTVHVTRVVVDDSGTSARV